jgi:hypothetical protein
MIISADLYSQLIFASLIVWMLCVLLMLKCSNVYTMLLVAIFSVVTVGIGIVVAPYTTEYHNGYNDYPNDTLYKQAKIMSQNAFLDNSYSLYCAGYEVAKKKDKNDIDFVVKSKSNQDNVKLQISRTNNS